MDEMWLPASPTVETARFPSAPMEVRGVEGRTIIGRAVPFDEVADIGRGYREVFRRGAFATQVRSGEYHRVKLYANHSDGKGVTDGWPLANTLSLREEPGGLTGEWPIPRTTDGDNLLELVSAGVMTGLSIGFRSLGPKGSRKLGDGTVERLAAHLDHVAVVNQPAYAGAGVTEVREQTEFALPAPLTDRAAAHHRMIVELGHHLV